VFDTIQSCQSSKLWNLVFELLDTFRLLYIVTVIVSKVHTTQRMHKSLLVNRYMTRG